MSQATQEVDTWVMSPSAYEWFQEQLSQLSQRIESLEAKAKLLSDEARRYCDE